MSLAEPILRQFEQEAPTTRRVLERVPLEKGDWQPHPKSMALGRLASWLAGAPGWAAKNMHVEAFDASAWEPLAVPATSAELLAAFDAGASAALAELRKLDDTGASAPWSFRMGEKTLMSFRRVDFLRLFLLSDSIHHRGQMSVYLRLLDVPVPSIYGPSADDNPFA